MKIKKTTHQHIVPSERYLCSSLQITVVPVPSERYFDWPKEADGVVLVQYRMVSFECVVCHK